MMIVRAEEKKIVRSFRCIYMSDEDLDWDWVWIRVRGQVSISVRV